MERKLVFLENLFEKLWQSSRILLRIWNILIRVSKNFLERGHDSKHIYPFFAAVVAAAQSGIWYDGINNGNAYLELS